MRSQLTAQLGSCIQFINIFFTDPDPCPHGGRWTLLPSRLSQQVFPVLGSWDEFILKSWSAVMLTQSKICSYVKLQWHGGLRGIFIIWTHLVCVLLSQIKQPMLIVDASVAEKLNWPIPLNIIALSVCTTGVKIEVLVLLLSLN